MVLEKSGCFSIVVEKIPATLAKKVAQKLVIPVIGIGAGPDVDGQVLVSHDMLGINKEFRPRFVRRYQELADLIHNAVAQYISDIKSNDFPNAKEMY